LSAHRAPRLPESTLSVLPPRWQPASRRCAATARQAAGTPECIGPAGADNASGQHRDGVGLNASLRATQPPCATHFHRHFRALNPKENDLNPRIFPAGLLMSAVLLAAGCNGGGDDAGSAPAPARKVTLTITGGGSVASLPAGINCSASCTVEVVGAAASTVLTATPASGQVFSIWGGDCTGTAPSCTLALDRDRSLTASFVPAGATGFALGVSVVGGGSVNSQPAGIACGTTCATSLPAGSSVTLSAVPAAGQVFSGWTGDCSGSAATCVLTMSAARSAVASFASAPSGAGWTAELLLSAPGASQARVALDANGRAIAVWRQQDAGSAADSLWGSRYAAGAGWSTPELLEASGGAVSDVHLALDPSSGRAMLVWQQLTTPGAYDLWARPFVPATGWGAPALVEAGTKTVGVSSVGIDAGGNAVAVWSQIEDTTSTFSIYASRYTAAGGWGAVALIENNGGVGNLDGDPIVAVAPSGSAVAVWKRSAAGAHLWSNRFSVTEGWGTAAELVRDEGTAQSIGAHALALDANGNGLLVWGQADIVSGTWDSTVWFKRFGGAGWDAGRTRVTAPVPSAQGFISIPVLQLNAAGAALVAWGRQDGSLVAAPALAGAAFGPVATVRAASTREVTSLPTIGIDDAHNALMAWTQANDTGGADLVVSRLAAAGSWSAPALHESQPERAATPALAMNARGSAVLAWQQFIANQGARIAVRQFTP